jgi:hypothetical protein
VATITIKGVYHHPSQPGWPTANWSRMIQAHKYVLADCTDIDTFFPGTFNVLISQVAGTAAQFWRPPLDEKWRLNAVVMGLMWKENYQIGADFLAHGNYVHPTARVTKVNNKKITGYLYCAGVPVTPNLTVPLNPVDRPELEIMSNAEIRALLKAKDGDVITVELTI